MLRRITKSFIPTTKCLLTNNSSRNITTTPLSRAIRWEPPYLDEDENAIPTYPKLNVQVKGYDFAVLENYASWIHNTATKMEIEVSDAFVVPCQVTKINRFEPQSTNVNSTYTLKLFERNVQLLDLQSTKASTFLDIIQAALPEGVQLSLHEHMQEYDIDRYIPDLELKALQDMLDELGGPIEVKK